MRTKPILVDDLIKYADAKHLIDGKWYVAKPVSTGGKFYYFIKGLLQIPYLLSGKAFLAQFKEDEKRKIL